MKASIYTAYHKPSSLIDSPSIVPMHVGRARAGAPLAGMIGDDTGDNISALNGSFCELTALYWAWKNDTDSTHLGLMHYRRLLDFDRSMRSADAEVLPGQLHMADYAKRAEDWLAANPDVDLVAPVAHKMPMTVRQNYVDEHDPRDLDLVDAHISAHSPEYLDDFRAVMDGHDLVLANMFVAKREVILPYLDWAFPILEALAASDIPRDYASPYNLRYIGFVAERLFTVYVRKFTRENPTAKVHRVNILNLSRTLVFPYMSGDTFNGAGEVNVAFSSDRNYLAHAAAMMRTMADHADPERRYNLFYLHEDLDDRDLELFASIVAGQPNMALHPINVGNHFGGQYRAGHHAPTNATFNRFLLFELLPDVNRLIYIDVDMVLRGDIAELFDIDMGEHQLAAVPDFVMTRVLGKRVKTPDPKVPDLGQYLRDALGMTDAQIASYFNAGLMVLNFAAMDVPATGRRLMEMVEETKYFFRDQDILNKHFKDSYLRLPARYNVFNSDLSEYFDVPAANQREALAARANPFIIHFAAHQHKPWDHAGVHFSSDYWRALERTPFWLETLNKALDKVGHRRNYLSPRTYVRGTIRAGEALADRVPAMRPYLLRAYHFGRKLAGR